MRLDMNDLEDSLYRLAIKERDYERLVNFRLEAEIKDLKIRLAGVTEEVSLWAEQVRIAKGLEEFKYRIIDPALQARAEQLDKELRGLIK
jgi:hypothetical protein